MRYYDMKGYYTLISRVGYPWTSNEQRPLERGLNRHEVGPVVSERPARRLLEVSEHSKDAFKRLGVIADWDNLTRHLPV